MIENTTNRPIRSTQRPSCDMSKTSTKTKSQPREDESNDEDGGPKPKSRPTVAKLIPQQQPNFQTSKTNPTNISDSEYEDGGIRPKRKSLRKKSKKEPVVKKKSSITVHDSMDEDGTMLKAEKKVQETKVKKKSLFFQCFHQPESNDHSNSIQKKSVTQDDFNSVDEDGGPIVKTYDTIKKLIHSKQPTLQTSSTTDGSASTGGTSLDNQTTLLKRTTDDQSICLLRRRSYKEAQDSSPPIVLQKSNGLIPSGDRDKHRLQRANKLVRLTIEHLVCLVGHVNLSDEQKRKKRVQNRWYLIYSLIHNSCLSKYRKQYLERDDGKQQSDTSTNKNSTETLRERRLK